MIDALTALVEREPRRGFWRLDDRLRNLDHPWNYKRVHRVYCALRFNRGASHQATGPAPVQDPVAGHTCAEFRLGLWTSCVIRSTMGGSSWTLNVVDQGNREALAIELGFSLPSRRVIELLEQLVALHGTPATLRMDNGPEFIALRLRDGAERRGIGLEFIQPGKPAQNAFIQRFNQTYCTEVLAAKVFRSLHEVRATTQAWLSATTPNGRTTVSAACLPLTVLSRSISLSEYQLQVSA